MRKRIRTEICYFSPQAHSPPLSNTYSSRAPCKHLPNRALCLLDAAARQGLALWGGDV